MVGPSAARPALDGAGAVPPAGGSPQLFLNDKRLLQQLEPAGQKLVFDLQKVSFAHIHLEGLIDDTEPSIVLDVLPPTVTMCHNP